MKYKIIHTNNLGSTPAKAIRKLGIIYINTPVFYKLSKDTQDFIIEHEKAHIKNDSNDEVDADQLAFFNFAGSRPESLRKSIIALSQGLSFDRDEHILRLYKQIERALTYDYKINKNKKAFFLLQKMKSDGSKFLNPENLNLLLLESDYIKPYEINNMNKSSFLGIEFTPDPNKKLRKNFLPLDRKDYDNKTDYERDRNLSSPRLYSLRDKSLTIESKFINAPKKSKKPDFNFVLKPLMYSDNSITRDTAEEQILADSNRFGFGSGGGGGLGADYDDFLDENAKDKMMIDNEKSKFLGMPRKTGIAVTIAAAVIILGIISYFIFKKP